MTLEPLLCKNCGAPLEKDLKCKYCNTQHNTTSNAINEIIALKEPLALSGNVVITGNYFNSTSNIGIELPKNIREIK